MELEVIHKFVQDHPQGIVICMIDGERIKIPHRDFITFGPTKESSAGKRVAKGTTFIVFEGDSLASMRLLNALLVKDVRPLKNTGKDKGTRRKAS
jgi:hypothetical protein